MPESSERGALTEAVYYIMLALCSPLHGYGIMQRVKELRNDRVNLGAGTLYGAINTLVIKGWIIPKKGASNSRKKEYEISDLGRDILKIEIERLKELINNGEILLK